MRERPASAVALRIGKERGAKFTNSSKSVVYGVPRDVLEDVLLQDRDVGASRAAFAEGNLGSAWR